MYPLGWAAIHYVEKSVFGLRISVFGFLATPSRTLPLSSLALPAKDERMSSVIQVSIHASQFPDQVRRDLLDSLRSRQVNHKFHYDSLKQTQKWLALHEAFSPARTDSQCQAIYDASFGSVAQKIHSPQLTVIGLGCGGGQKETSLLRLLAALGKQLAFVPCDVSAAMVLVAATAASEVVTDCRPVVFDIATADDLPEVFDEVAPRDGARLVTFFGMIPNFEPHTILSRLTRLLAPGEHLLFSANLAPGPDYDAGVQKILPQYDNALTREWLLTFLLDLGVERTDGAIRFRTETCPQDSGVKRIAADFYFDRARLVEVDGERFEFQPGDTIRLFFSYRYTPGQIRGLLNEHFLGVLEEWITESGEEGVFLCRKIE